MEKLHRFFELRPAIRVHYEQEGSFFDYVRRMKVRLPQRSNSRLSRLILGWAQAQPFLNVDLKLLRNQLEYCPIVSSADHCGVLDNAILFNANILFSGMLETMALPYQVVFATTRIPLNNASNPKGIFFQGRARIFFPTSFHKIPMCLLEDGLRGSSLDELFRPAALHDLEPRHREFLEELFFEKLDIPGICNVRERFDEQIPLINHKLWPLYFHKDFRHAQTGLLYIPTEYLVNALVREDIGNPGSRLAAILFDPAVRSIYLEEFQGIAGCWSLHAGTHFFWGVNTRKRLVPLRINQDGNCLESAGADGDFSPVELNPDSLCSMIDERKLIPSLFTEMFLLAFVEGYALLGGFNQVTYLAWMRVAHEKAMLRLGDWPQAARYARTMTDGLICGPMAYPEWQSGMDCLWQVNSQTGSYQPGFQSGITRLAMDTMMSTSLQQLITNGVDAMLDVLE